MSKLVIQQMSWYLIQHAKPVGFAWLFFYESPSLELQVSPGESIDRRGAALQRGEIPGRKTKTWFRNSEPGSHNTDSVTPTSSPGMCPAAERWSMGENPKLSTSNPDAEI